MRKMALGKGKEQIKYQERYISLESSCMSSKEWICISVGNHKSFVNRTDKSSLNF